MTQVKRKKSSCYCINLRQAAKVISNLYDDALKSVGISVTQYSLLSSLGHMENCNVSDLAKYVGLERTTLVRTLKPLTAKGLVADVSEPGERDRRLRLTNQGKTVIRKAKELWSESQREIERRIGKEDAAKLEEILLRLLEQ